MRIDAHLCGEFELTTMLRSLVVAKLGAQRADFLPRYVCYSMNVYVRLV